MNDIAKTIVSVNNKQRNRNEREKEKIMSKEKPVIGTEGIYDARTLGAPRMLVLGIQHMFAMFGATVLVPVLTGLSVTTTLLFAGLGTLLFHLLAKGKVPAFLGSSFAFLAGYQAIAPNKEPELLPYACAGVAVAGLLYVILAALFRAFGAQKVMRFFPPIVTGPVIICIGLTLSSSALNNCAKNWPIALVAIVVVIVCNIWGKGMIKIIPILLGVVASYVVAAITGNVDFTLVEKAAWIGSPVEMERTVFALFGDCDTSLLVSSMITIVPLALATMIEHIGDICAISSTCERNYLADPGLHRTLLGDGLATMVAGMFGGPANTTYGENTGVLALSKIYDPLVIRIAAVLAIILSFSPKFEAVINTIPTGIIGGISFVLYGMISAIGVRNVVENRVDFTNSRNLIVAAVILVCALGFNSVGGVGFTVGSVTINLSGLAVAAIAGILLNAILPGNDYEFDATAGSDAATSGNLQV